MMFNTNVFLQALSGLVAIFSGIFILATSWDLNSAQLIMLGIILILSGVLLAGSKTRSWLIVFLLIVLGIYFIARGNGAISYQYLKYGSGTVLLILGSISMFQLYRQYFNNKRYVKK